VTKSAEVVLRAIELHGLGHNTSHVARELRVSRAAVRDWTSNPQQHTERVTKVASHDQAGCSLLLGAHRPEYAYLLGQYLGDGCISAMGPRGVFRLRIQTCDDYPNIRQRCEDAIAVVMPRNKVGRYQGEGCTEISSYSKHWPCFFPQHGRGRKHERSIELTDWQCHVIDQFPLDFIAGLIHADGCRALNNVIVRGKAYSYPRYFFTNFSADILEFCKMAFDRIGVDWKQNRWNSLSVAKRDSVALLDTFIGPKS
jgi:hypothetical protein